MAWRKRVRLQKKAKGVPAPGAPLLAHSGEVHSREPGQEQVGRLLLEALLRAPNPRQRARALEIARARENPRWVFCARPTPGTRAVGLGALPEARRAEEEERQEQASGVPPQAAPMLQAQAATGRPLDPLAQALVHEDLRDPDRVRVHTGADVDRLARRLGRRAFTVGSHIFLDHSAAHDADVLVHELSHAVRAGAGSRRVRYWGGAIHRQITRTVARELIGDEVFIRKLEDASVKMDYRVRRLARAAVPFLPILGGAAAGAAIGSFFGGIGALVGGLIGAVAGALATPLGLTRFPPEGPEHGEGGDYRMELGPAREINLRVQRERLRRAVEAYNAWKAAGGPGRPGLPPDPVFVHLGDALHIAQDRGAHWEGAKGMGHDDPRHKHLLLGWSPDSIQDNPEGYQNALINTREVLTKFIAQTEFTPLVLPPMLGPEETGRAMA